MSLEDAEASVYALRAALQRLAEAHGHVTEALRELDVYVSAIGGHGVHPSRDVIADLAPDPGHRPRLSEIVHELIEGLDRPGSGQTVGALADRESGRPISHRLFSGRDGPAGTGAPSVTISPAIPLSTCSRVRPTMSNRMPLFTSAIRAVRRRRFS